MKYAVEAKVLTNGKVIAKIRPALEGEESNMRETNLCGVLIDVFDSRQEAEDYYKQYK